MKSTTIFCAATLAAMGFATAAQARDWQGERTHEQDRGQAQVQQHQTQGGTYRDQQRQQYTAPQGHSYSNSGSYSGNRTYGDAQRSHGYVQNNGYAQNYSHDYAQNHYAPQYRAQESYVQRGYAPQYRSYGYAPRYAVGGYAPTYYRSQRYWINDWQARRLSPPPYGYQWVSTDAGDALLVALATGLIANAIFAY